MTLSRKECLKQEVLKWLLELYLNLKMVIEELSHQLGSIAKPLLKEEIKHPYRIRTPILKRRAQVNLTEEICYHRSEKRIHPALWLNFSLEAQNLALRSLLIKMNYLRIQISRLIWTIMQVNLFLYWPQIINYLFRSLEEANHSKWLVIRRHNNKPITKDSRPILKYSHLIFKRNRNSWARETLKMVPNPQPLQELTTGSKRLIQ